MSLPAISPTFVAPQAATVETSDSMTNAMRAELSRSERSFGTQFETNPNLLLPASDPRCTSNATTLQGVGQEGFRVISQCNLPSSSYPPGLQWLFEQRQAASRVGAINTSADIAGKTVPFWGDALAGALRYPGAT